MRDLIQVIRLRQARVTRKRQVALLRQFRSYARDPWSSVAFAELRARLDASAVHTERATHWSLAAALQDPGVEIRRIFDEEGFVGHEIRTRSPLSDEEVATIIAENLSIAVTLTLVGEHGAEIRREWGGGYFAFTRLP